MGHVEAAGTTLLRIEAVYCPQPGSADTVHLLLPAGVTLAQALRASGLLARHGLVEDGLHAGVWGRTRPPGHLLGDRDRVEIYRPLQVDPKEARRQRYLAQKTVGTAAERAGSAGKASTAANIKAAAQPAR